MIARTLGRALNELIIHKDLEEIDSPVREVLNKAGIDVEQLSSAIEIHVVTWISEFVTYVEAANTGRLFKTN